MSEMKLGQVKWFNVKRGYGFITMSDGTDVFVHHESLQVEEEQYRYLVQGEYVSFELSEMEGEHSHQATNVRGVDGGRLMCETRRLNPRPRRNATSSRGRGGRRGGRSGRKNKGDAGEKKGASVSVSSDGKEMTVSKKV